MSYGLNFFAQIIDNGPLPHTKSNQHTLDNVLFIVFSIAGGLAFLMVVIAGFRYILAGGDTNKVAEAKSSIAHAAAGLIVAAAGALIVKFVLSNVK